jgi:hypothetical protein
VDLLSYEALVDNIQLVTGASKVGGGWQESIDDHSTMMVGNDK